MNEIYRWECWHDRPKMEKIKINWEANASIWWKIIAVLLVIAMYILGVLIQVGYFITLPFAFINEYLRS